MELFAERGYHATKISDIVKAADVTQPTFYLYFKSKESLYEDLNIQFQLGFYEIMDNNISEQAEKGLRFYSYART
ncbi:TetR family transcriptional regulator OS=Lysinibacillus sphaericus OX=1421 GN=LS41612_19690 PE=4 SV=1 [Lysinibacillus sphaericus]